MKLISSSLVFIIGLSFNVNQDSKIAQCQFFPKNIETKMICNLKDYLIKLPQNKGQQKFVERLLSHPEYQQLILFLDTTFSVEILNKTTLLDKPFLLIETLDIISSNQELEDEFSNWYFTKLFLLVKERPTIYMRYFILYCKKSDGFYAEWFADPLEQLIMIHPHSFLAALKEIDCCKKITAILMTGYYTRLIQYLKSEKGKKEIGNTQVIDELLECLAL